MSEANVNRESLTISLEERYKNSYAGGAFNVHTAVQTEGTSAVSVGDSYADRMYTNTIGFVLKQEPMKSEFKEVSDGKSGLGLSRYVQGLDTTPYR